MSLAMVNLSKRYRAMSCAPLHFPGLKTRVGSLDENVERHLDALTPSAPALESRSPFAGAL